MNILNKIYAVLIVLLLVSSIVVIRRSLQKIDYKAGCFSAVPIHARQLYFVDTKSSEYGNLYAPDPNYFAWKQVDQYFDNNHIDVPDSLHIEYFSYTDSLFYNSTLALDNANSSWKKYINTPESLIFTLGIADKGIIKLWCSTPSLGTQLILAEQLPAVTPKQEDLYYKEPLSKAQYIVEMFSLLDDSTKNSIHQKLYTKSYRDSSNYQLPEYIFR